VFRVRGGEVPMKKVEELDMFKLSHLLTLGIFEITKSFPDEEKFGLVSQMRRAAYSIPMNLMEGAHRLSSREYRQFAGIAKGSTGEIKYQLLLVKDLEYISEDQYSNLKLKYERVSQMLTKLAKSLE
jgi:four helix bundle protein